MDLLGNADHSGTGTEQQFNQTDIGGTAVVGTMTVTFASAIGGSGTADVYVYIAP